MARLLCNECLGLYDEQLPPDPQYYHRCPPRTMVRIIVGGGNTTLIPLQAFHNQKVNVLQADGTIVPKQGPEILATDIRLGDEQQERATARDENVIAVPGRPGRITREGLGTQPAPDPPPEDAIAQTGDR